MRPPPSAWRRFAPRPANGTRNWNSTHSTCGCKWMNNPRRADNLGRPRLATARGPGQVRPGRSPRLSRPRQWAWPRIAAVYVMAIAPGLAAFTLTQRWYMRGLQEGALKY